MVRGAVRRLVLLLAIVVTASGLIGNGRTARATGSSLVVTLSFDDAWDSQTLASSMLAADGLVGTFYVNSGFMGTAGHLTWAQLDAMNAAGNEVGGHTVDHPDLTTLTSSNAQHEICDDRTTIQAHGFIDNDFAYPFGAYDSNTGGGSLDVSSIVKNCGYSSGRGAFGLHNITATNDTRPYSTSTSPSNPYKILVPCCINHASFGGSTPTAAALESYVQHAQAGGGGWVDFFFHRLCDNCGDDDPAASMSPAEFSAFLDWLKANNITVETVGQVLRGDTTPPVSSIVCGGSSCSGWYKGSVTVSLSASDTGSGVAMIHYTTDGSDPTVASPTYTGPFTVSSTTTVKYRAWDKAGNVEATESQPIQIDTTAPVSSIACNGAACSGGWYTAAVTVSLSAADSGGSGLAAIHYTTDGSDPTADSPIYAGPLTVSTTTTVKYAAWDNAGNVEATESQPIQIDTTAPVSSIACNGAACSGGWYTAALSVSLSAVDSGSGVASIHYTTDDSDPTLNSLTYMGPFNVSATATIKYRAWDLAGNVEPTNSQTVQIDAIPPTASITCNGSACSTGWYNAAVSVSLSATDSGGSGLASIHYTTDGSDPGSSSTTYSGPFSISTTTTVKYRASDNAGNASTGSKTITIDGTAPAVAIASPTNGATVAGTVTVSADASDTGGAGVASVSFYLDGTTLLSTQKGPKYTFQWNTRSVKKGQHTLTAVAKDNAGNTATSATVTVTVK
jgi:peptidoglycan/xylan/chitin deacetylase (PgdA/CDA1 family)